MGRQADTLTVVVTGGGRGIGRALATALLQRGHRVCVTAARQPQELEQLAAGAWKERLLTARADVREPDACERLVAATVERFGRIDALINNAGRGMVEVSPTFHRKPTEFWRTDPDTWHELFDVNVHGVFHMTRAVVPVMQQQGGGRIVQLSTSLHTMVRRGFTPYGPSKAALEAMSAAWAQELLPHGILLNVLLPGGATDTAFVPGEGPGRRGADGKLLPPEILVPPLLALLGPDGDGMTSKRVVATEFDAGGLQAARDLRDVFSAG